MNRASPALTLNFIHPNDKIFYHDPLFLREKGSLMGNVVQVTIIWGRSEFD